MLHTLSNRELYKLLKINLDEQIKILKCNNPKQFENLAAFLAYQENEICTEIAERENK